MGVILALAGGVVLLALGLWGVSRMVRSDPQGTPPRYAGSTRALPPGRPRPGKVGHRQSTRYSPAASADG
jgi:hypothetical protein